MIMAKKESNQHLQIISDIQQKKFKPVYFLMGLEPYYIDLITNTIIENEKSITNGTKAEIDQIV